jgi:hypothetical protein
VARSDHDARHTDRDDDGTTYNPFADLLKNARGSTRKK